MTTATEIEKTEAEGKVGDSARSFLTHSIHYFEICARHAVEAVLVEPTRVAMNFCISHTLRNTFSTTCALQAKNDRYSAYITAGINTSDLQDLLPTESNEVQMDSIKEVTNILAGNFFGKKLFASSFGYMTMGIPQFLPAGMQQPKALCIEGVLKIRSSRMFLGMLVAKSSPGK